MQCPRRGDGIVWWTRLRTGTMALLPILAGSLPTVGWAEEGRGDLSFGTGLLSAYVSEGRENFDGAVAWEGHVNLMWDAVNLEVVQLNALENSDWETTLAFGLEGTLGRGAWGAGFAHITSQCAGERGNDNEAWLTLAWPIAPRLELGWESIYSFGAAGAFHALSAAVSLVQTDSLLLGAYGLVSYDHGYARVDFAGSNHLELGLTAAVPLGGRFALETFVAATWGLSGVDADGGEDLIFGGVMIGAEF